MVVFKDLSCVDFLESIGSILTLAEEFRGEKSFFLSQVLPLDEVYKIAKDEKIVSNSVLWVRAQKDIDKIKVNQSIVLVSEGELGVKPSDCLFIKSARSRDIFGEVTNFIEKRNGFNHRVIYKDCDYGYTIWNNVEIADDVLIGAGSSIGGPGFGYFKDVNGKRKRFSHLGGCIVRSGCEIGANVTIDSGTLSPTVVGENVKIDSNVHIGHNAKIGCGTVICASATICGSVEIGKDVFIGAGAIIMDKVKIPADSVVGLGAVVRKTPHETVKIIPIFENKFRRA